MDKIELGVLEWIQSMADCFKGLVLACESAGVQDAEVRKHTRDWGPDAFYIGKLYLEALQARHDALEEGDFGKYCAATYTLTQDWSEVRRSIPWLDWGGSMYLGSDNLQAATMLVCGVGNLGHERLVQAMDVFTQGRGEEALEFAEAKGAIIRNGDSWHAGPRAPKCRKEM